MDEFVDACALAELPPGEKRAVRVGDTEVALLNIGGTIYAVDNDCPHRGGPLCEGDLQGFLLHCPLHAWPFDVRTGRCTLFTEAKVRRFDVRVRGDRIEVSRSGHFD